MAPHPPQLTLHRGRGGNANNTRRQQQQQQLQQESFQQESPGNSGGPCPITAQNPYDQPPGCIRMTVVRTGTLDLVQGGGRGQANRRLATTTTKTTTKGGTANGHVNGSNVAAPAPVSLQQHQQRQQRGSGGGGGGRGAGPSSSAARPRTLQLQTTSSSRNPPPQGVPPYRPTRHTPHASPPAPPPTTSYQQLPPSQQQQQQQYQHHAPPPLQQQSEQHPPSSPALSKAAPAANRPSHPPAATPGPPMMSQLLPAPHHLHQPPPASAPAAPTMARGPSAPQQQQPAHMHVPPYKPSRSGGGHAPPSSAPAQQGISPHRQPPPITQQQQQRHNASHPTVRPYPSTPARPPSASQGNNLHVAVQQRQQSMRLFTVRTITPAATAGGGAYGGRGGGGGAAISPRPPIPSLSAAAGAPPPPHLMGAPHRPSPTGSNTSNGGASSGSSSTKDSPQRQLSDVERWRNQLAEVRNQEAAKVNAAQEEIRSLRQKLEEKNTNSFDLHASLAVEEAEQARLRQEVKRLESELAFKAQEVREADRMRARAEQDQSKRKRKTTSEGASCEADWPSDMSVGGGGSGAEGTPESKGKRRALAPSEGHTPQKKVAAATRGQAAEGGMEASMEVTGLDAGYPVPSIFSALQELSESLCLLLGSKAAADLSSSLSADGAFSSFSSATAVAAGASTACSQNTSPKKSFWLRFSSSLRASQSKQAHTEDASTLSSCDEGLVETSFASQLYLSLWSSDGGIGDPVAILNALACALPLADSLGSSKVIAALRVARCLLLLSKETCQSVLLPSSSPMNAAASSTSMVIDEPQAKGDKTVVTAQEKEEEEKAMPPSPSTIGFFERLQGSKVNPTVLEAVASSSSLSSSSSGRAAAAAGGKGGKTEGAMVMTTTAAAAEGLDPAQDGFISTLISFLGYLGEKWKPTKQQHHDKQQQQQQQAKQQSQEEEQRQLDGLWLMTKEALSTILTLVHETSVGREAIWDSLFLMGGSSLALILDGAMQAKCIDLVDLCVQVTNALAQHPRLFDKLFGISRGRFIPSMACQVLHWHLDGEWFITMRAPVDKLCLRMIRMLSRICAKHGRAAICLLSASNQHGLTSAGGLLACLVTLVHQEIDGLLNRKGAPEAQKAGRLMLAREAYKLLTLLSVNNAEGLSAGLSHSASRWILESANFRLMNQMVNGLEDLHMEAEALHKEIQSE